MILPGRLLPLGTSKPGRLVGSWIGNDLYPCLACGRKAGAKPETHIGDQARRGVPCGGAPLGSGNFAFGSWVRLIESLFRTASKLYLTGD